MRKIDRNDIENMCVPPDSTIREIMEVISRGMIGAAFIIDPKTKSFIDIVADGDIRRAMLKGRKLDDVFELTKKSSTKTATVGMSVEEISSMFGETIRVIPILDEKKRIVDIGLYDQRFHLPVAEPNLGDAELKYVTECVLTGWVSSTGKFVRIFEEKFAEFCNTRYAVATSSGTSALHLALVSLDIGPGDEVIIPSFTFISTANAVVYTGATPVCVDSDEETWNIDPSEIEKAITSRTKAIIPVHLYGHPADMDAISYIANKHKLAIIEDAAEAHGALYKGKKVGSLGSLGIFSFYGNKTITTGEGGMIVTDSKELADKIRILRDHGMDLQRRYWHTVLGYNYRLTNIQAALGVAQLERIDEIIEQKRKNATLYMSELRNVKGITLPPEREWAKNIYWLFSILIDENEFGMSSEELSAYLKGKGIETRPLFPPVHKQPIYNTGQNLPVAEKLATNGLSLPSSVNLREDEILRICNAIRSVAGKSK